MHLREGKRATRLYLMAMAGLFVLGACTDGSAAELPDDPPSERAADDAPDSPPPSVPSVPSATDEPTPSAEDEVEAAYARYLNSTVAAMESADATAIQGARSQALAAARARVAVLASQERIARGAFVPAIQSLELDGDTARLRDCYRAGITEHDRDTGKQVADRAGTRFGATVELKFEADDWVVVEFNQGEFCVPDELAQQIEGRYVAFWEAVAAAGSPPDPDHPALADTAAGQQLAGLRDRLADFAREGYEARDESVPHPVASRIFRDDTVAVVRDCRDLDAEGGIFDIDSGELIDGGASRGQRALWETRLELIDEVWKVVDANLVEEDSACDPAAF